MAPTPHFLLSAAAGWRTPGLPPTLAVTGDGSLALAHLPGRGRRLAEASGCAPLLLSDRRGLAATPWGDLILADPEHRRIEVRSGKGRALRALWGPFDWAPWDVAVDLRGTIWVSDPEGGRIHRFDRRGREGQAIGLEPGGAPLDRPERVAVDCEGRLYVGRHGAPHVAVYGPEGEPLELVALDGDLAWEAAGTFLTLPLDSGLDRCPWHRVVLEGAIPRGTRVTVSTFTSEAAKSRTEVEELPESRWALGAVAGALEEGPPGPSGERPSWDCLVQSPPGRHLWLRLDLAGDGASTPAIRRVRVELPRRSSLQRLPAVYQEDVESRHFLDRWLSIFDTTNAGLGEQIGSVARLFDPRATPAGEDGDKDFLGWLAGWLGLSLERHLPVRRRRRLLAETHRLYRLRGTRAGLELALRLTLGVEARVLEHHRLRRWMYLGAGRLGDCAELFGPDLVARLQLGVTSEVGDFQLLDTGDPLTDPFAELAHRFTVYVPKGPAGGSIPLALIRRVVELAKPAHAEATIEILEPRFVLGEGLRVGLSTVVGRYPRGVRLDAPRGGEEAGDGGRRLGHDTVLTAGAAEERSPTFRVGTRSRIGASTLID